MTKQTKKSIFTKAQGEYLDAEYEAGITERDQLVIGLYNDKAVSLNKAGAIVTAWMKDRGYSASRSGGFREDFYEWLKEAPRTMDEVKAYCEENGSENTMRHLTHFQGIAQLANHFHNS